MLEYFDSHLNHHIVTDFIVYPHSILGATHFKIQICIWILLEISSYSISYLDEIEGYITFWK